MQLQLYLGSSDFILKDNLFCVQVVTKISRLGTTVSKHFITNYTPLESPVHVNPQFFCFVFPVCFDGSLYLYLLPPCLDDGLLLFSTRQSFISVSLHALLLFLLHFYLSHSLCFSGLHLFSYSISSLTTDI